MSNVKSIYITGVMPFNITNGDVEGHEEATKFLGYLNAPSVGFRITYGNTHYEPNKHGGKTAMYEFTILGYEAWRFEMIEAMIAAFEKAGCKIFAREMVDVDNQAL